PVAGEGRIDQARNDCVDGDAVLAEFQGGRLHQADNAPFRGGISSTILRAVLSLRRGGNDDAAAAVLHQVRSYRADRVAGAGQIDIDLVVPVRILHFEDGFESLDAGIGEEDVDLAEG